MTQISAQEILAQYRKAKGITDPVENADRFESGEIIGQVPPDWVLERLGIQTNQNRPIEFPEILTTQVGGPKRPGSTLPSYAPPPQEPSSFRGKMFEDLTLAERLTYESMRKQAMEYRLPLGVVERVPDVTSDDIDEFRKRHKNASKDDRLVRFAIAAQNFRNQGGSYTSEGMLDPGDSFVRLAQNDPDNVGALTEYARSQRAALVRPLTRGTMGTIATALRATGFEGEAEKFDRLADAEQAALQSNTYDTWAGSAGSMTGSVIPSVLAVGSASVSMPSVMTYYAITAFGNEGQDYRKEMERRGLDPSITAEILHSTGAAATEFVIERIGIDALRYLPDSVANKMFAEVGDSLLKDGARGAARVATQYTTAAGVEGFEEGFTEFINNTRKGLTYSPETGLWDNVPEAFGGGALGGVVIQNANMVRRGIEGIRQQRVQDQAQFQNELRSQAPAAAQRVRAAQQPVDQTQQVEARRRGDQQPTDAASAFARGLVERAQAEGAPEGGLTVDEVFGRPQQPGAAPQPGQLPRGSIQAGPGPQPAPQSPSPQQPAGPQPVRVLEDGTALFNSEQDARSYAREINKRTRPGEQTAEVNNLLGSETWTVTVPQPAQRQPRGSVTERNRAINRVVNPAQDPNYDPNEGMSPDELMPQQRAMPLAETLDRILNPLEPIATPIEVNEQEVSQDSASEQERAEVFTGDRESEWSNDSTNSRKSIAKIRRDTARHLQVFDEPVESGYAKKLQDWAKGGSKPERATGTRSGSIFKSSAPADRAAQNEANRTGRVHSVVSVSDSGDKVLGYAVVEAPEITGTNQSLTNPSLFAWDQIIRTGSVGVTHYFPSESKTQSVVSNQTPSGDTQADSTVTGEGQAEADTRTEPKSNDSMSPIYESRKSDPLQDGFRFTDKEGTEFEVTGRNTLGIPYFSKVVNGKTQSKQFAGGSLESEAWRAREAERNKNTRTEPRATAKQDRKPDQAVVNVPLSKRGNIDAEIDKAKKQKKKDAKSEARQRNSDRQEAREIFARIGDTLIDRLSSKNEMSRRDNEQKLRAMIQYQPSTAVDYLRKVEAEYIRDGVISRTEPRATEAEQGGEYQPLSRADLEAKTYREVQAIAVLSKIKGNQTKKQLINAILGGRSNEDAQTAERPVSTGNRQREAGQQAGQVPDDQGTAGQDQPAGEAEGPIVDRSVLESMDFMELRNRAKRAGMRFALSRNDLIDEILSKGGLPTEAPKDRVSFRDWRLSVSSKNNATIVPRKIGARFTDSQVAELTDLALRNGYKVEKSSNTAISLVRFSNSKATAWDTFDNYGYRGDQKAESERKAEEARQEESRKQSQRQADADSRESGSWLSSVFGDTLNPTKQQGLADIAEGKSDAPSFFINNQMLDRLRSLGVVSGDGVVDWAAFRNAYQQSKVEAEGEVATTEQVLGTTDLETGRAYYNPNAAVPYVYSDGFNPRLGGGNTQDAVQVLLKIQANDKQAVRTDPDNPDDGKFLYGFVKDDGLVIVSEPKGDIQRSYYTIQLAALGIDPSTVENGDEVFIRVQDLKDTQQARREKEAELRKLSDSDLIDRFKAAGLDVPGRNKGRPIIHKGNKPIAVKALAAIETGGQIAVSQSEFPGVAEVRPAKNSVLPKPNALQRLGQKMIDRAEARQKKNQGRLYSNPVPEIGSVLEWSIGHLIKGIGNLQDFRRAFRARWGDRYNNEQIEDIYTIAREQAASMTVEPDRRSVKVRVRQITGLADASRVVRQIVGDEETKSTEAKELRKQLKRDEQTARKAFRDGVKSIKATLPAMRQAVKEAQKLRDKAREDRIEGIRKQLRRMIEAELPASLHGRFIPDLMNAKTLGNLADSIDKMRRELSRYDARHAINQIRQLAGPKALKKLDNETREKVREMLREAQPHIQTFKDSREAYVSPRQAARSTTGKTVQGIQTNDIVAAAEALNRIEREIAEEVAYYRAQRIAYGANLKLTRDEFAKRVVENIGNSKRTAKQSADGASPDQMSVRRTAGTLLSDTRLLIRIVEGKSDGDAILEQLIFGFDGTSVANGEDGFLLQRQDDANSHAKSAKDAGYKSYTDLESKTRRGSGKASTQMMSVQIGGEQVEITVGEAMHLYAMDSQTRAAFLAGTQAQFKHRKSKNHKITDSEINAIISKLTDQQKEFVDRGKDLMEKRRGPAYRVIKKLKGQEPEIVPGYFPRIRALDQAENAGLPEVGRDGAINRYLENLGLTKDRDNSFGPKSAPIVIGDFTEILNNHLDNIAKITHLAEPIRNVSMVLLHPEVQREIIAKHGLNRLEAMKTNIAHMSRGDNSAATGGRIARAGARVASEINTSASIGLLTQPGTWLRQISGGTRFAAVVSPRYWAAGIANAHKVSMLHMVSNSGFFWERYIGNMTGRFSSALEIQTADSTDDRAIDAIGRAINNLKVGDISAAFRELRTASTKSLEIMNKFDSVLARIAWAASEAQVNQEHPEWSDDQKLKWVAWNAANIMRQTQATPSPIDSSYIGNAARNTAISPLFLFTSEVSRARNMVYTGFQKSKTDGARAVAAEVINIAISAIVIDGAWDAATVIVATLLSGEWDEFWERVFAAMMPDEYAPGKILSDLAGATIDPFVTPKIVDGIFNRRFGSIGVDTPALSIINESFRGVLGMGDEIIDIFDKDDDFETGKFLRSMEKSASAALAAVGLNPLYASHSKIRRDMEKAEKERSSRRPNPL